MKKAKKIPVNKKNKKKVGITKIASWKARVFVVLIILAFSILLGRIVYWQFIEGDELAMKQSQQSVARREISSKRGTIYDANKKAIAISADVDTITSFP